MSDYRTEFADLLRATKIPANDRENDKRMQYSRLNGYIRENMPMSLFRYRSFRIDKNCIDYNIKALCKDYTTVTKPCEMGDVFDSQIIIDEEKIIFEVKKMEGGIDSIADYLFEGKPIPYQALQMVSPLMRRVIINNQHILKGNLLIRQLIKIIAPFVTGSLKQRAKYELANLKDILRDTGYIACFYEDVSNLKMWSDYADKHRGYALGYAFDTLNVKFNIIDIKNKRFRPDYIVSSCHIW